MSEAKRIKPHSLKPFNTQYKPNEYSMSTA